MTNENLYKAEAQAYMNAAEQGQSALFSYINSKLNDPRFSWNALHLSLMDLEKRLTKRSMADLHILIESVRFYNAIKPYMESNYGSNKNA